MRPLLLLLALLLPLCLFPAEAASAITGSAEAASAIACSAEAASAITGSAEAEGSSEQEMRGYAPRSSSASAVTPELAVPDSTWKKLDAKLEEYVKALERESTAVKEQECDFILETVTLQDVRDRAARKLYNHYRHSPVMGDEAVAIHLFDRWFSPGKVSFEHNDEFSDAQVFADFNRSSLIGMQAPPLTLLAPDGTPLDFPADNGHPKILYFYDTDCASCKITTPVLKRYLDEHPCEADLYAVYVGDSEKDWKKARKNDFPTDAIHAWDPELRSDFQRLYGVLTTPKLFLIAPDGTILGRCLDVPALHLLLVRNHVGGVATPLVDESGHVGGQR